VDTDGDGIPDDEAVLLPPFEVNGNDPDTFDWEGYWEWLNDISEDEYSEDEMGGASEMLDFASDGAGYHAEAKTSIYDKKKETNQVTKLNSGNINSLPSNYSALKKYLTELKNTNSSLNKLVNEAVTTESYNGGLWEAGVVTVVSANGNIIGSQAVNGNGPNNLISTDTVNAAIENIKGNYEGEVSAFFYHDHKTAGPITDSDIATGAVYGVTVDSKEWRYAVSCLLFKRRNGFGRRKC
jgi:hypothetical protein